MSTSILYKTSHDERSTTLHERYAFKSIICKTLHELKKNDLTSQFRMKYAFANLIIFRALKDVTLVVTLFSHSRSNWRTYGMAAKLEVSEYFDNRLSWKNAFKYFRRAKCVSTIKNYVKYVKCKEKFEMIVQLLTKRWLLLNSKKVQANSEKMCNFYHWVKSPNRTLSRREIGYTTN